MKILAIVTGVSLFAVPLLAQEPSLAELAERQKKARKGQTKVITEDDLRAGGRKPYVPAEATSTAAPAASSSPAASGGKKEKSDLEIRAEKKAEFEAQIKKWVAFIAETKKLMEGAQLELNDNTNMTISNRRVNLQKILDEGQQHIADAEKEIADIEEQARRLGVAVSR